MSTPLALTDRGGNPCDINWARVGQVISQFAAAHNQTL